MKRRYLRAGVLAVLVLGLLAFCGCGETRVAERTAPLNVASYRVREGKALFDHYCAVCHGGEGKGDGFNSYNLDPKPRNLADPQLQAERSDEELLMMIQVGGGAVGLSNAMPPWGRTMNDRQIRNIVAHVRSLGQASPPERKVEFRRHRLLTEVKEAFATPDGVPSVGVESNLLQKLSLKNPKTSDYRSLSSERKRIK